MKVHISYLSKTGITRKYAAEMNALLKQHKHDTTLQSILDTKPEDIVDAGAVLLGAWCHGLFILLQHPDKPWIEFASQLPDLSGKKVVLFTTYKLATGSMFRKMKKHLKLGEDQDALILKSKNGSMSDGDKDRLLKFLS